jgi:UDP-N-acetylmuramate dehydrogenase
VTAAAGHRVQTNAPIDTWFGVGGCADVLATPDSIDELRALIGEYEGRVRVLGAGANLLVDDAGVGGLVVSLASFNTIKRITENSDAVTLCLGAGVDLPRLIIDTVRDGLGGLEGLGGIPASIGGACRMNAGGSFGQFASAVRRVQGVDLTGQSIELERDKIAFGYRASGLEQIIITEVEIELLRGDPAALRTTLKEVMAHKKKSQPMAEHSAGCIYKNPLICGNRISAGKLIDDAVCKGMHEGGAEVSTVHGNFITTKPGATACDVLALIDTVRQRVFDHAGVTLETEVVIWRRSSEDK